MPVWDMLDLRSQLDTRVGILSGKLNNKLGIQGTDLGRTQNLGVISMHVALNAMRLNQISNGMNGDRKMKSKVSAFGCSEGVTSNTEKNQKTLMSWKSSEEKDETRCNLC